MPELNQRLGLRMVQIVVDLTHKDLIWSCACAQEFNLELCLRARI